MEKILTGKCLKDCYNYHKVSKTIFCNWRKELQIALIIEFFDSLGLWEDSFYFEYRKTMFKDFKRALTATLITVSKNYNNGVNRKM